MVSPSLRWWQKLGSRTRVAVDAAYMRADGNYPFTLVNGKYVTEEKRNNTGIYSWQGEATLYHTFKDDSELDVKGYYFYSRRGLPGAVTLYNPLSDETLWDENTFVQARYRKHFSPRWSLQAQAKYNHAGTNIRMRVRNIPTDIIGKITGKTNIIFPRPFSTVLWKL